MSTSLHIFQIILNNVPGWTNTSEAPFESKDSIFSFLTVTPKSGFGIYSLNFLGFILIIMILHLMISIFSLAKKLLLALIHDQHPRSLLPLSLMQKTSRSNLTMKLQKFMISFICYSLIYCSSQLFGGLILNLLSQTEKIPSLFPSSQDTLTSHFPQHHDYPIQSLRQLEETSLISTTTTPVPTPIKTSKTERLSLAMAKIAGSLDVDVSSVILSKDNKLAFAIIDYYGSLKVIDISDPRDPIVKGSLNLIRTEKIYKFKALTLSADEKTLYVSNFQYLEVINIKNPANPTLLGKIKNPKLPDDLFSADSVTDFPQFSRTTIEVSADGNYVIVGGLGLQIFDVSLPQTPLLVRSNLNNLNAQKPLITGICLSKDRKTLFFANKTLTVYDISNPRDMQLISSFETSFQASSVLLSNDAKTIFIAGQSYNGNMIQIEKINITIPTALTRLDIFTTAEYSFYPPALLAVSPCNTQVYVFTSFYKVTGFLVFDMKKKVLADQTGNLLEKALSIVFSADGKRVFSACQNQFIVLDFLLDYPNSQIFGLSNNTMQYFNNYFGMMVLGQDGKTLFTTRGYGLDSEYVLEIWKNRSGSKPSPQGSYRVPNRTEFMEFSSDFQKAFLVYGNTLEALKISNFTEITPIGNFTLQQNLYDILDFQVISEGNIGAFLSINETNKKLASIKFYNLTGFIEIYTLKSPKITIRSQILFSKNQTILFIIQKETLIYDISNPSLPILISSTSIAPDGLDVFIASCALTPDSNTLLIETYDNNYFRTLRILNITNLASLQSLSEFSLPLQMSNTKIVPLTISPDSQKAYIFAKTSLLVLSISDPSAPWVVGIIPLMIKSADQVLNFLLSPDGQTAYYNSQEGDVYTIHLQTSLTVFLSQEKFSLGEKYTDSLVLLQTADFKTYEVAQKNNYKFIKFTLLDIKIILNQAAPNLVSSVLPSWMSFDSNNNQLTIEPKKSRELGNYTLCSSLSSAVSYYTLLSVPSISNFTQVQALLTTLISLGYLDNQGFLTTRFGRIEDFVLTNQFSDYKDQIYRVLKQSLDEICTQFEVIPSLKLDSGSNNLVVETPSTASIRVDIQIHSLQKGRENNHTLFLNRPYASLLPIITDKKSHLALEGSLRDINKALGAIVVNFDETSLETYAEVTVTDGLNPPLTQIVNNLRNHFRSNSPPVLNTANNKTLQNQIDLTPIYTGQYFTINLAEDTFIDPHVDDLKYQLAMKNNQTELPSWLSFQGLTLKGTPPEEFFRRNIELVLIAKNEFKQTEASFNLHIKVSSVLIAKTLIKFSPYVITLLGLFVSANRIFNIFLKGKYRHPKDFSVYCGEEITPEVIFPVSFIREEVLESEIILRELEKYLAKKQGKRVMRQGEIARYFTIENSSAGVDKEKIERTIEEVVLAMKAKLKEKLRQYDRGVRSRRLIVIQIIVNRIVGWKLDTVEENTTRNIFEKIKSQWAEVIEFNTGFTVNMNKLKILLSKFSLQNETVSQLQNSQLLTNDSLLYGEVEIPGLNIALLKDGILAFAFEKYHVNARAIDVDIQVCEKIDKGFLMRFLKMDLKHVSLNDRSMIDYGINYKIRNSTLYVYGNPDEGFKEKVIVIQVLNHQHKILKELWIEEVSNHGFKRDIRDQGKETTENIARGKGYEIY